MKIVVGSVLSRYPLVAGSVVNRLNFVVGLRRLGHEVFLVEEVDGRNCVDADGGPSDHERSANRALFLELTDAFGLSGRACQIADGGRASAGTPVGDFLAATKGALLINMSGHVTSDAVLGNAGRRVYVDQDPVYTQLWHTEYGEDLGFRAHDAFFSVGLNIGTSHSPIPDAGRTWHPLLPVIVPELWSATRPPTTVPARFTTVASWSGYGDLEYRGQWFGTKHGMFAAFADLPRLTGQSFEVALKSHRDDDPGIERLRGGGWTISSARELSSIERYRDFIRGSTAEIGVAKGAYVRGSSGWFSDRAAHYLASGRPVLAQATGFERMLPTGEGVVTFETPDDAVAGAERIRADPVAHSDAALAFVREHLDYRRVLPEVLERCMDETSGPSSNTSSSNNEERA